MASSFKRMRIDPQGSADAGRSQQTPAAAGNTAPNSGMAPSDPLLEGGAEGIPEGMSPGMEYMMMKMMSKMQAKQMKKARKAAKRDMKAAWKASKTNE